MLRVVLLAIVLLVAVASARHGNGERDRQPDKGRHPDRERHHSKDRHHDTERICREANPGQVCAPKSPDDYPTLSGFSGQRNLTDIKSFLLANNTLENLCNETGRLVDCAVDAVKKAPKECLEQFARYHLTSEDLNKYSTLHSILCTNVFIGKVRRNLDCIVNQTLIDRAQTCFFANFQKNCTDIVKTNITIVDEVAERECYEEKLRPSCDSESVVACAADQFGTACSQEAAEVITVTGNSFFDRFPICRGNGSYHALLKFFKK